MQGNLYIIPGIARPPGRCIEGVIFLSAKFQYGIVQGKFCTVCQRISRHCQYTQRIVPRLFRIKFIFRPALFAVVGRVVEGIDAEGNHALVHVSARGAQARRIDAFYVRQNGHDIVRRRYRKRVKPPRIGLSHRQSNRVDAFRQHDRQPRGNVLVPGIVFFLFRFSRRPQPQPGCPRRGRIDAERQFQVVSAVGMIAAHRMRARAVIQPDTFVSHDPGGAFQPRVGLYSVTGGSAAVIGNGDGLRLCRQITVFVGYGVRRRRKRLRPSPLHVQRRA